MLFPQENKFRELKTLDGVWDFCLDEENNEEKEKWYLFERKKEQCIPIAVPASFNDQVQDIKIRDYVGNSWYYNNFFAPAGWENKLVWIWFGAVHYRAKVWINGKFTCAHTGGSLPFWAEISSFIKFGQENTVSVLCNNELTQEDIPPGVAQTSEIDGVRRLKHYFDFFNYSGIHRPVKLFTTSPSYIDDITISTDIKGKSGIVEYSFDAKQKSSHVSFDVEMLDGRDKIVFRNENAGTEGIIQINNCRFWSPKSPCLYSVNVIVKENGKAVDQYIQKFGVRTVKIKGAQLLLNGKPVYLTGSAKHEDFYIIGRGMNLPVIVKDYSLLKWINANSFRTSHYPYADEILEMADRLGFLVIDETPAVGMNEWDTDKEFNNFLYNNKMLDNHIKMLEELVRRDKNHPSVIMWSVANEPKSWDKRAVPYFKKLSQVIKKLDATRPSTVVLNSEAETERIIHFFDVLSVNKYHGWYNHCGNLGAETEKLLSDELDNFYKKYKLPIILTEFGVDTIEGHHSDPHMMFSEEYQVEFYKLYGKVLDSKKYVIGEHTWVFSDFMTKQEIRRVMGNRKGIFTRSRQPKMAAHFLKERWAKKRKD